MPEPEYSSGHHCKIKKLMREIIIVRPFFCKLAENIHYRFAMCEKLLILQGCERDSATWSVDSERDSPDSHTWKTLKYNNNTYGKFD